MKKNILSLIFITVSFISQLNAKVIPSGSALTIIGPTTITQSGNYRLGNNIAGTIIIDADNVTIDLENKTLTAGTNGISINGHQNITIKNGTINDASMNGILVDTCRDVSIENIIFTENADAGISVLTTTEIKINDCTFTGHSNIALSLGDVNSGFISECSFNFNSADPIIDAFDSTCITLQSINICQNIQTFNGIRFNRIADSTCIDCHVDNNAASTLNGWRLAECTNIVIKDSTANSNNATMGGTSTGCAIITCTNILLDFFQSNKNTSPVTFTSFAIFQVNESTFNFCEANANAASLLVNGFGIDSNSASNVFKHCNASNNIGGISYGFNISFNSINNCFLKCIAKENNGTSIEAIGFFVQGLTNLFEDCIAKSNSSVGFSNSVIAENNVFLRNVAQSHGAAGATNFFGIPNIATLNPTDGTYTAPVTGDHPNTDNISVVLP